MPALACSAERARPLLAVLLLQGCGRPNLGESRQPRGLIRLFGITHEVASFPFARLSSVRPGAMAVMSSKATSGSLSRTLNRLSAKRRSASRQEGLILAAGADLLAGWDAAAGTAEDLDAPTAPETGFASERWAEGMWRSRVKAGAHDLSVTSAPFRWPMM